MTVAPGAASVSTNASSSRDPRESEHIRLTCESAGGNPAPNITWYRNGAPLSTGVTHVSAPVKFAVTSSLLDVKLRREDNEANFTCRVHNGAGTVTSTVQLSVHCTPL